MEWPFPISRETLVGVDGESSSSGPIRAVFRHMDGDWQFFPSAALVGFGRRPIGNLVDDDPTLNEVADLAAGHKAVRETKGGSWERSAI